MGMHKKKILIFLIIYVSESSCVMDALYDAGEKVWEFYSTLNESNLDCLVNSRDVEQFFGHDHRINEKIYDQIYEIHEKLSEIEKSINSEMMDKLTEIMNHRIIIFRCIELMKMYIESIDDDYTKFYQIISQDGYVHDRSLSDSPKTFFPDIASNIEMIRKIMVQPKDLLPDEKNLITAIKSYAKTRYEAICNSHQPIDEILVYLFKIAIIAEIKTSLMWTLENLHQYGENEEWKVMNIFAKSQFQWYFGAYLTIMQRNMDLSTDLYIRACDPRNSAWILNENYYELNGITQTMIFGYQPAECPYQSCENIWKYRSTRCDARYYDKRSSCSSTVTDCQNLGAVQACILKSGPLKFQYVNSTILGFYGKNSTCPENNGYIIDNGKGSDSAYVTCGCHCDGNHNKISLAIMESTEDSNKRVITGLRFKRENNILHIQPRAGKLMGNGYIKKYSERWLQIPNDTDASQIHFINAQNSIFFLDDILLPPKFVLTGVRFNKVIRGAVTGFAIEIFGVPFNYRSGQLHLKEIIRVSSSTRNSGRPLLFDSISSLQTKKRNTPSSTDRNYVQLRQSSLRQDFGQSMQPLFDAAPVTTDPPSALSGIGIFHKGIENYAGFISLRAYGIRYAKDFENFISAHTIEGRLQLFT